MFRSQAIRSTMGALMTMALTAGMALAVDKGQHMTGKFEGPKANTGTAVHMTVNGKSMLRVSDDFKVPDTPAPTWRVVDSKGTVYTLDAFKIKGGEKREIAVPAYVHNIAKVQVYCAWAEVLLGESSFPSAVK
ncbi:MAG: hypothetical protein JNK48_30240 [Bryobacterales bacterium]|nr:hypothetical protein [Bryobacterales bacterium]